jgi:hypothetical protein
MPKDSVGTSEDVNPADASVKRGHRLTGTILQSAMLTRLFGRDVQSPTVVTQTEFVPITPRSPPIDPSSDNLGDAATNQFSMVVVDLAHEIEQAADKAFAKADAAIERGDTEHLAPLYVELGESRSKTARNLSGKDDESLAEIWH